MKNGEYYQRWMTFDENGTKREKLIFDLESNDKRDEIILEHFMAFIINKYKAPFNNYRITERNNRHDFTVISGNNELYIEIVSAAGPDGQLKQSQHRLATSLLEKYGVNAVGIIPPRSSRKSIENEIKRIKNENPISGKELGDFLDNIPKILLGLSNPILKRVVKDIKPNFLITWEPPSSSVNNILEQIKKKEDKKYKKQSEMILIIEDRHIFYGINDFQRRWHELALNLQDSVFKEIYLYSGRFSSKKSKLASFTIFPLKTDRDTRFSTLLFLAKKKDIWYIKLLRPIILLFFQVKDLLILPKHPVNCR